LWRGLSVLYTRNGVIQDAIWGVHFMLGKTKIIITFEEKTMRTCKFPSSMFGLFLVSTLLSGCGASGPMFKPVAPLPTDKGVVYIYRESSFVGGGVFGTVTADKTPITKIRNGGYYPYISKPGTVHFEVSTEATNEADVVVEAGKEKYLKTSVGMGFFVGHLKFSEVSQDIGRKEISECQLLDPIIP